ncbi:MAG: hypothetical protein RJB66_1060 [Pseudomonadota bacterium]
MTLFSVLFLLYIYWQPLDSEIWIQNLAAPAQEFCKNLLTFNSIHLNFYRALSCGTPVADRHYEVLKTVSLWHLVVVSAGHFKIIQWLLQRMIPRPSMLHLPILFVYCLMTGAQAPIIRAFFELLIGALSSRAKLWIPSGYSLLYSGCLCLILFPGWSQSWSLLLCWLCAVITRLFYNQGSLMSSIGIAIGVFPIMSLFSTPHPLSFLFNLVLAPVLSIFLFPLSLLMVIVPQAHFIADPCLDFLLQILKNLTSSFKPSLSFFKSSNQFIMFCWFYLFFFQLVLIFRRKE